MMKAQSFNTNEYCSWITSRYSPHNCIITGKINGDIDFIRFQNAVKTASEQQPMLRNSISSNTCGFIPTHSKIKALEFVDDCTWQAIAEKELATPFLDNEALARITLLETSLSQYIIICFHHIIGDGISGVDFLRQLLHCYNHPDQILKLNDEQIEIPTPTPKIIPRSEITVTGKTRIKTIHIESDLIQKIKDFSKANFNALLSDIILKSSSCAFNVSVFNAAMPVNLRRNKKKNTLSTLRFYTSWIDFLWENDNANIQLEIKKQLREQNHKNNLTALTALINQRKSDAEFFTNKNSTPKIFISNVGLYDNSCCNTDLLKLTELHLSVNCEHYHKTPNSFTIQLSELSEHGLFININYCDAFVSDNEVALFAEYLKNTIQGITCQDI